LKAISQSTIIITEWISATQNGLIKLPSFCFDSFSDLMTMVERILRTQIQLH
jgi:hypothetical protein